jgi:signal transduction histidine kinase
MQIAELRHLEENKNDYNNKTEVIVKIKDTGIGISSEMMPRLFTKFATTSEKGGNGLGCLYPKVL